MQAVIQRASSGAQTQQVFRTGPSASETVTERLAAEFPGFAPSTIARCVDDAWICAEHLGLAVNAGLVERVAREHLLGVQNSVPPSLAGIAGALPIRVGASRSWSQYAECPGQDCVDTLFP
ncbi:MAG: hypothetical protein ACM3ML_02360 [Micromonosporaceae bacterium]